MRVLFLDFDGVLNNHRKQRNGFNSLCRDNVRCLNRVLEAVPDLMLVISSAWRYYVHNGHMTSTGLERLMQTHGVSCYQRVHGVTEPDGKHPVVLDGRTWDEITDEEREALHDWGALERVRQIRAYIDAHGVSRWAVVDDMELPIEHLFQTESAVGLTDRIASKIASHFPTPPTEDTPNES